MSWLLLTSTYVRLELPESITLTLGYLFMQALQLALACLQFDFVGTCVDEASEELGTIQVECLVFGAASGLRCVSYLSCTKTCVTYLCRLLKALAAEEIYSSTQLLSLTQRGIISRLSVFVARGSYTSGSFILG